MEAILKNEINIYEKYFKHDREIAIMRKPYKTSVI